MIIAPETIAAVKDRARLLDVVGEVVRLKRAGSAFVGLCPFHTEKTGSFNVREDGYYHCFGCGEHGDVISFVMKMRGVSFGDAVEELASRYSIPVRYQGGREKERPKEDLALLYRINQIAWQYFSGQLSRFQAGAREYLLRRGLKREALAAFGVGAAPNSWNDLRETLLKQNFKDQDLLKVGLVRRTNKGELVDLFRGRVIFPIFVDDKHIAGFGGRVLPEFEKSDPQFKVPKYVNSPESPIYQKSKVFFGLPQALQAIRANSEVYLVEGYMDVIGLWQAGVKNVVATCGTAITEEHLKRLKYLAKRVVLMFDGDEAGRSAAGKSFPLFVNSGLEALAVFLPDGEDPDTFALKHAEDLSGFLAAFPRRRLYDCYLDYLIGNYVPSGQTRDLGPAAKGKIAVELVNVIGVTQNAIEKNDLLETAAARLAVRSDDLVALAASAAKSGASKTAPGASQEQNLAHALKKFEELEPLDQMALTLAMGLKGEATDEILKDPDISTELGDDAREFITRLNEIFGDDNLQPAERKECVKLVLDQQDKSWTDRWRTAYTMANSKDVDFFATLLGCRQAAKKSKFSREINEISRKLRETADEAQKAELVRFQIELRRQQDQCG